MAAKIGWKMPRQPHDTSEVWIYKVGEILFGTPPSEQYKRAIFTTHRETDWNDVNCKTPRETTFGFLLWTINGILEKSTWNGDL